MKNYLVYVVKKLLSTHNKGLPVTTDNSDIGIPLAFNLTRL
jgi:hypothetical protein